MVSAVVLMQIKRDAINEVAQRLVALDGVREVFSVAGRYDLVALLRVADNAAMATLVTEQIRDIAEIEETETLLAFKTYAKEDMEAMFSVGFEEEA
ncbi:MAG: Lrp/AsnC ligand binding domain-containing protein [Anaerolineales bacterium]|nr:Lrp/AsnC ligand binding domain-containing protein [Anaerolineales bacterium]MCB9128001.1 Lrp/AsnC ligand binding domain-containing protein [Ardenticatenales bacterium]MCB9172017.1 Lrp/AsnC ligand binding domain-containing protein [Ardenticatenales bacterium]